METALTFIVRIYRRARGKLTGVVEDVQGRDRTSFSSAEELWKAIDSGSRFRSRQGSSDGETKPPD